MIEKKIAHKQKIQKHNINKIHGIDTRVKEMTYLMTIIETKKTFSTFQLFRNYYWNNGSGKLIAAVRASNLKRLKLWKFITSLCASRKTILAGQKQPLRGASRKQLILNYINVKIDNLQVKNIWKIPMRNFWESAELQRRGSNWSDCKKRII